ncbi:FAD/NAD(P)-binding domain-containing protein [Auriculariales sp. MPI-PUGE-AT-0066]|nr:FAD/NAD(P)-binding domain-containing protein [Auriculariales sp. MPI-PUGE-AT-0066]
MFWSFSAENRRDTLHAQFAHHVMRLQLATCPPATTTMRALIAVAIFVVTISATMHWTHLWQRVQHPLWTTPQPPAHKRIAIVGLGSGGITALRALSDLPPDLRSGLSITAFDERESVGGLWLPEDDPPAPPVTPMTPLYPGLRTNGPHPMMTIPNTPLEPETPLLAPSNAVLRYWERVFAETRRPPKTSILFQQSVLQAKWNGSQQEGEWHLSVRDLATNGTRTLAFDHVIAAPGVNRIPRIPAFTGQEDWLQHDPERAIMHCMWYRDRRAFENRTVLVVGGGPSGLDMARHSSWLAKKVYWSRRDGGPGSPFFDLPPDVESVPPLSHFTSTSAHLSDGSVLSDIDYVILATGYDIAFPFITSGGQLDELVHGEQPDDRLTTNLHYVRPLYEHTLSLDSRYPLGALYFVGILTYNPTGMTCYAQSLFAAYTIVRPDLLGTRSELLVALKAREARVRAESGLEPGQVGHKIDPGYGAMQGHDDAGPFQDTLVHSLRTRDPSLAGQPGIPGHGFNFTERWRVYVLRNALDLLYGWHARLDSEGEGLDVWEGEFVRGVATEADYLDAVARFVGWWRNSKEKSTWSDQWKTTMLKTLRW